ncbi:MAG TPA: MFS transporter [Candidatus Kryptonia bacterium]|nr:MFS transporter [Candidatus Kryptonia bacterium]
MSARPPSPLRRSLRASTFDAMSYAAMIGCGEFYFPAFALLLGATPLQVGIVATVPILVGSAFQLLATAAAHRIGDRLWVIASASLQAAVFIPIVLLTRSTFGGYPWLFALVCLYWILNLGINPAWNAWMGRMIPPEIRSRYFGRRNVAVHSMIFLALLLGGFLIDAAERSGLGAAVGFAVAFGLAAGSRSLSVWFLTRQHDPGRHGPNHARLPARTVLSGFRRHPYGRLILLIVLINGAVNISAAYFTPYMLQRLDLSYARFTILNGTIVVARVMASSYWGEIARNYGNRRALQVSTVLLIPLASLWVLSNNYAFLLGIQLFGGFAWAGFELASFLNLFDCTDDRNRAQVLSIYTLLNGVMIVTGSLLGGAVMHALGDRGYHVIFVTSSTCRLLVVAIMLRGVGVKRRAQEHSFRNVFTWVMTLRPGEGEEIDAVVMDEDRPRRSGE